MRRMMLKSKVHRATATETNLEYDGSLTLDTALMEAADMLPHEQVPMSVVFPLSVPLAERNDPLLLGRDPLVDRPYTAR